MLRRGRSPRPPAFHDRVDAGIQLADALRPVVEGIPARDLVVIGLTRGGVVTAAEVARELGARLEALVVRKLGAPRQPELAIGAITAGGTRVLNRPLIEELGLTEGDVEQISLAGREAARALASELGVPAQVPGLTGKVGIVVDDGLATGATMRVAVEAVRAQAAARVVVAVPVAPESLIGPFRTVADDVVAVIATNRLNAVGRWYLQFGDVRTPAVRLLLQASAADAAVPRDAPRT